MAFFDSLMSTINKGTRIGKLRIAINVKLLFALDAMAETIVSKEANPKLPNKSVSKNKDISCTIFPIKTLYTPRHKLARIIRSKEL